MQNVRGLLTKCEGLSTENFRPPFFFSKYMPRTPSTNGPEFLPASRPSYYPLHTNVLCKIYEQVAVYMYVCNRDENPDLDAVLLACLLAYYLQLVCPSDIL